jgi:hypothetical protein
VVEVVVLYLFSVAATQVLLLLYQCGMRCVA